MNLMRKNKIFGTCSQIILLSLLIFFSGETASSADVSVNDNVCLEGETIMLKAQTKKNFFIKGGEIVEFFINGKSLGKNLSGGDGYAFREYTPAGTGLYKISVKSKNESDDGLLLSLKRGYGIVFVDVEGSLFPQFFSKEPMPGSRKTVKAISRKYNMVYIKSGLFDIKAVKKWLSARGFPALPVLSWDNGEMFDALAKKGLKIKYVIGNAAVINSAKEYEPKAFSFVETDYGERVRDWEEIGKKMKLVIK